MEAPFTSTETAALRPATTSWPAEVRRYRAERLRVWPFAPLVLALWGAGAAAAPALPWAWQLVRFVTVVVLVLGFRLLDDLVDVPLDRLRHPGRVLVQSARLTTFWRAVVVLAVAQALALLSLDTSGARLALLAAVWTLLGAVYAWKRRRGLSPLLNAPLVLAKYPAFVLLAWSPASLGDALPAALLPMHLAYLALLAWEFATDADLRSSVARSRGR